MSDLQPFLRPGGPYHRSSSHTSLSAEPRRFSSPLFSFGSRSMEDSNDTLPPANRCRFQSCLNRVWFTRFATDKDVREHAQIHRCQWVVKQSVLHPTNRDSLSEVVAADDLFYQCPYIPDTEEDQWAHLDQHVAQKHIPSLRGQDGKLYYFCPWQSCTSVSYSQKGSTNRSHIVSHVKKHITIGSNDYRSSSSTTISPVQNVSRNPSVANSSSLSTIASNLPEPSLIPSSSLTSVQISPVAAGPPAFVQSQFALTGKSQSLPTSPVAHRDMFASQFSDLSHRRRSSLLPIHTTTLTVTAPFVSIPNTSTNPNPNTNMRTGLNEAHSVHDEPFISSSRPTSEASDLLSTLPERRRSSLHGQASQNPHLVNLLNESPPK